jgi:amidase
MSPLGLGNDIGGSLRNPAHCCGVASIKPTTGVVPHASAIPPEDGGIMAQLMAVQGVMARSVADVRAGLLAVAGMHHRDPVSLPVTLTSPAIGATLRVAVLTDPPGPGRTDPGISAAIRHAADALADAGHQVADAAPASFERSINLWGELLIMDINAMRPLLDAVMGEGGRRFLDLTKDRLEPTDAVGWSMLFGERAGVARDWSMFFESWDVLLTPTWPMRPFEHGADVVDVDGANRTLDTIRAVVPANLLGLPAAIAPAGVVDGLPVGAQFIGNRFADLTTLAAAQALEDIVGPLTPIDPITA